MLKPEQLLESVVSVGDYSTSVGGLYCYSKEGNQVFSMLPSSPYFKPIQDYIRENWYKKGFFYLKKKPK